MGEAKRRGTYEQRKAEGERKRQEREALMREDGRTLAARRGKSRMLPYVAAMLAASAWQEPRSEATRQEGAE